MFPKPPAQARKCLVKSPEGVNCRKLDLKLNYMWCFNCQQNWALQAGRHNITKEKEGPCSLSSPGKEATDAWSSFKSIAGGMVKYLKPTKCPSQLRPAFWGSLKQAVYAGIWEASNIDQLKKRDHSEVKDIDLGLLRNAIRGLMTKVRHIHIYACRQQWRFDCLINSSPFSHGNTVCTYQFFSLCSIPSLKYTALKAVQCFTAQALFTEPRLQSQQLSHTQATVWCILQ